MFCFVFLGVGVRHSMLMIFLSWVLYYPYKKCSNSWGHSKSTYALMEEGRGGTPKTCENMQRESDLPRVYVSLYLFKGVFSHLQLLIFVFHFFNGKVKTLTPWKVALYIAANLTLSRYLDSSFYKCNVQIQLDYNFFQLKKQITQKNQIWTLFQQKTFKSNSDVLG